MNNSLSDLLNQLQKEKDSFKKAKIIRYLYREKMVSLKKIAVHLHKHPSFISHYLQILKLPEIVLDGYYSKDVSEAHLFILSRLKKEQDILKAYKMILSKSLSTAQTEEVIRELKFDVLTTPNELSRKEIEELIADFKNIFLGVNVKIIQSRIRGKIILELKGDTKKTTSFIKNVVAKLARSGSINNDEDDMQVLE